MKSKLYIIYFILFVANCIFADSKIISWPTPEFIHTQRQIENCEISNSITFLQNQINLPNAYNSITSNGYPIIFYYQKLLADVFAENDNPVDAIDTYRAALSWVPLNTITSHPIPYAKALHGLAKQFMDLQRWADAEDTLLSISFLVDSKKVKSDLNLCKATRSMIVGEINDMGKFAEKSINEFPDYNWQAYHLAAWSKFAVHDYSDAAQYWLAGFNAFSYSLPIDDVVEYLDEALCYWKIFNEDNIREFYKTIDSIILANLLTSKNAPQITRLLKEKVKLEILFPDLCIANNVEDDFYNLTNVFFEINFQNESWQAKTNAYFGIRDELLESNKWERIINEALYADKKKNYAVARSKYEKVINDSISISNCNARIQGYPPAFFAASRRAQLNKTLLQRNNKTHENALDLCNFAVGLVLSNKTDKGDYICLEEIFSLLKCKAKLELYSRKGGGRKKALETYNWASGLFPDSVYTKYINYINKFSHKNIKNLEELKNLYKKVLELPMLRPSIRLWKSYEQSILAVAKRNKNDNINQIAKLISENYLEGLESSVFDFCAPNYDPCHANFPQTEYVKLMELLDFGALENNEILRLYNWLLKVGLTIPADGKYSFYLSTVLREVDKFSSIKRKNLIELTLLCDATPWRYNNSKSVYIVFDFMDSYLKMETVDFDEAEQTFLLDNTTNIFKINVTIPNDILRFKYSFFKSADKIPDIKNIKWLEAQFVKDDGTGKMLVKTHTTRDFNLTTIIQCQVQDSNIKQMHIMGFPAQLGNARDSKIMNDDGLRGDKKANDGIFSYAVDLYPSNSLIFYVFLTNKLNKSYNKIFPAKPIEYKIPLNQINFTNYLYHNFNNF